MNHDKTSTFRILSAALLSAALLSAGLLVVAVGCQNNKADDESMQTMEPPAMNLRSGIPPDAMQVGQESESPSFTPDKDGRVYIYDRTANKTINSFQVRKGQNLIVSGQQGRATLDGNDVAVNQITPGRTYQLYFLDPTQMGDSNSSSNNNNDTFRITPANGQ